MSSYFDKSLIVVGFAATVALVGVSGLACASPALIDKTTDDDHLTAEQCIDDNTLGSVEPYEQALVREGIVDADLDEISITHGICEEVIERTPGGSPIARAAVVGNLTQELQIIKKSMETASDKDVNGDGMVNAEDKKTAKSASFAASHAAQETLRRSIEEGSTNGGGVGELKAEPAAYLQDVAQGQYDAGGGGGGGEAQPTVLPSRKNLRNNASDAAQEKGADKKAAGASGECAATVTLVDGTTLHVTKGNSAFDAPAKEMHWKEHDIAKLVIAPKAWGPVEQLKQKLDQAKGAGVRCMQLGGKMEAYFVPNDDLTIESIDPREQDVQKGTSTTWRWDVFASERGPHPLYLNVAAQVYSSSEGGGYRSLPQKPYLFNDQINVSATRRELFTDFVASRWSVLVPIFLTIMTAIIIPFVILPWWRRRNQPRDPRDRSNGAPRDDGWI